MMVDNEVAIATGITVSVVIPMKCISKYDNTGTMISPPPMPSIPAKTPTTEPKIRQLRTITTNGSIP
jgi:hypothetical protein